MTRLFPLLLMLSLTLFSYQSLAANKSLVGHWKGEKISLNLYGNKTYSYKMKFLTFKGKYTVEKNVITLNYRIAGIKKKRTAVFKLKGNKLILTQKGKGNVVLTRQK
ncbi:MAG: Unknown protein [uncultured Thiotrichaceae bacterium]|uniref:DUF5640 domain-containing protein n=1 Tax=uncultured Thiotrichaceae bacterium TaxID=298394 RepID=A0A6S6S0P0_9GAMM|nr:MAG: Unknown protein [uncultured Thiotrichaceae bacterium]